MGWAEDGRLLVAGEQTSVDAFIAELARDRELDLRPYRALSEGVRSLGQSCTGEMAKRYVELSADRWKQIASSGGVSSELRVVARGANVRGHEKVPGGGQVEVPAGGQVRSPLVAK